MSMPSINLDCNKCGYSGSTMVTWGDYNYRFEDQIIGIDRELGWCLDCEGFVAVEDFNNASEILAELKELIKPLKESLCKRVLITLFQYQTKNRVEDLEKIDQLATQLNMIIERKGNERCLKCSGLNILPFKGDYRLEFEGLLYKGLKNTGFIHPVCGGEIIASPNQVRFNMKFEPKYYSPAGKREINLK